MSQTGPSGQQPGSEARAEALRQLLERTRLTGGEVTARLASALSETYWRSLYPGLSVGKESPGGGLEAEPADASRRDSLLQKFTREGYFQYPLLSPDAAGRMAGCIEALRAADWPPVFAFVYDEFWEAARGDALSGLLSGALGEGYRQIPHIWSHYVHPGRAAGWRPHVDSYKRADRVTVWIALNDATLDNGCIYLVPKNMAPGEVARNFPKLESLHVEDVKALLHGSRALPVGAGTALCWGQDVIHWGAACGRSDKARISISQEFIAGGERPGSDETPLLDARRLPTFAERLRVTAKAVVAYQLFEPLTVRYLELAERLLERLAAN